MKNCANLIKSTMNNRKVIKLNISLLKVRLVFLFVALVHLVVTAVVTLSIDTRVDDDPKVRAYYYVRWKLITCWFNLITLAYIPVRLYCDLKTNKGEGNNQLVKHLQHACDVIFTGILFPVVVYSDVTFWFLFTKDPALLGPPRIFYYLPYWAQHSLHTVSFFVVILDLVLTPRQRPENLKPRLIVLVAFVISYTSMLFISYFRGEMVYQAFADMNLLQMLTAATVSLAMVISLFTVQWRAIDYLWGLKVIEIHKYTPKMMKMS